MTHAKPNPDKASQLCAHQESLKQCSRCDAMIGPVVTGQPVASPVLLVGQAPGAKEGMAGRPFAWTAGKTLFNWFGRLGITEEQFRRQVYMSAVCRCFPGKNPKGGDRVPNAQEIEACSQWLHKELELLRPQLILPVGKLAITQFIDVDKLTQVIGRIHSIQQQDGICDVIPLPHPSGASTWHRTEPGKSLLQKALELIGRHRAWNSLSKAAEQMHG
ncbi:MAG: uracil-DNA glycosylase family protein [Candidatus Thiodiazotropha endolucinida]